MFMYLIYKALSLAGLLLYVWAYKLKSKVSKQKYPKSC